MKKIGIAFSSKDRPELTEKSLPPLLAADVDVWWYDGSVTEEGKKYFNMPSWGMSGKQTLTGGSCRYIVKALTDLLAAGYDYIGLVENDVRLHDNWFLPTMELFEIGHKEGLEVGAVSARCYEDRVLIQRDGHSVNHNLGAGQIIFSRKAAAHVLQHYRTHMTSENRRTFSILTSDDIGRYWAFRGGEHMLVADWGYDRQLAEIGLSSLALTPAKAEQMEDIKSMGLTMVDGEVTARRDKLMFSMYQERLEKVRKGELWIPRFAGSRLFSDGMHITFPHQVGALGGWYSGDWRFRWSLAWGCFAWQAGDVHSQVLDGGATLGTVTIPILGPCDFLVTGGKQGGKVRVEDSLSKYTVEPDLQPENVEGNVMQLAVPSVYSYRLVKLTALTPGVGFFGIRTRHEQPCDPNWKFSYDVLPPL